ncbi:MAG: CAP domain-containing protein [Gemmatimonadota bacterium]
MSSASAPIGWVTALLLVVACAPAGPRRNATLPASPAGPTSALPARDHAPDAEDTEAAEATRPAVDPMVESMIDLVNGHRRTVGCGELRWDQDLAGVALKHSETMRDEGFFDHVDSRGHDAFDRVRRANIAGWTIVAENLALTQRPPEHVLRMWLDSPGHRENLERCTLRRHGIGRADGFWTHVFTG